MHECRTQISLEGAEDRLSNFVDRSHAIDLDVTRSIDFPTAGPTRIIVTYGLSLIVVHLQSSLDRLLLIIISLHQRLTGHVIFSIHSRRIELYVIRAAGAWVNSPPTHPANDLRIVHDYLYDAIDLDRLGL